MIQIKYSNDIDDDIDIIPDLINIEKKVYLQQYCGEYDSIKARYKRNKDTFILAYNDLQMIGYLCFLPITQQLYDELIYSDIFHDDDILPENIESYFNGVNLYLLSVAILPEYQNTDVIVKMSEAFMNFLNEKASSGIIIKNIIASAVTKDGEKYLQNMNFIVLKKVANKYVLYHLNYSKSHENKIPVTFSNN